MIFHDCRIHKHLSHTGEQLLPIAEMNTDEYVH